MEGGEVIEVFDDDENESGTSASEGVIQRGEGQSSALTFMVYRSVDGSYVGPDALSSSVQDYLYCQVCKAKFTNVSNAMLHYKGRPHMRVLEFMAEKVGEKNIPTIDSDKNVIPTSDSGFVPGKMDNVKPENVLDCGIFVDNEELLWGPEKHAVTLGEFKKCQTCGITSTSFKTAREHYAGVKHLKLLKGRATEGGLTCKDVGKKLYIALAQGLIEQDGDPLGIQSDAQKEAIKAEKRRIEKEMAQIAEASEENRKRQKMEHNLLIDDDDDHYCQICQTGFTSKITAKSHYMGKKHIKNLDKMSGYGYDTRAQHKYTLDLSGSGILYCKPCDVMCLSEKQLEEHYAGEKHLSVTAAEREQFETKMKTAAVIEIDERDDAQYGCHICDIKTTSKENYLQHIDSKKHRKKFHAREDKKLEERVQQAGVTGFKLGSIPTTVRGPKVPFTGPPQFQDRGPFDGPGPSRPPRWENDEWEGDRWHGNEWEAERYRDEEDWMGDDYYNRPPPYYQDNFVRYPGVHYGRDGPRYRRRRGSKDQRGNSFGGIPTGVTGPSSGGNSRNSFNLDDTITSSILSSLPHERVVELAKEALTMKGKDIMTKVLEEESFLQS